MPSVIGATLKFISKPKRFCFASFVLSDVNVDNPSFLLFFAALVFAGNPAFGLFASLKYPT
jgi:hypothetical protein